MMERQSSQGLCLIGGGEHARVVTDLVEILGKQILHGFWGPHPVAGLLYLGDDAVLRAQLQARWQNCGFHLAVVGKPGSGLRQGILANLADVSLRWETLIHPRAYVSPKATLGEGCFVGAMATIQAGARVDAQVVLNTGVIVEHDVRIGRGSHLAPGSVVGGGVEIGAWSVIGLGARIRDHVRIGEGAIIGMGAVVVRDVPPTDPGGGSSGS